MKQCTKCKINKILEDFPKSKRFKSGYNSICKICCNLINKKYRNDNHESFLNYRKQHYHDNIDKMRAAKKKYYASHKIEKSLYDINYRSKNAVKIKEYKKKWEFLQKDEPLFKIKRNLRRRVHHALFDNIKSDKTFQLIGCTPEFFKKYIESLFQKGMSWENYGEWHIDHISPCFTFNLSIPSEQKKCFHYTNQRPLWKLDNLSRPRSILKSSKID